MSPEQVLADPHEIDIRTDVYALGEVLYELLAGRLPYNATTTFPDAFRIIREEDSTALGVLDRNYRGTSRQLPRRS
jgi:serine/threonine protein kinase